MQDEQNLLPCPFCGSAPFKGARGTSVSCVDVDCSMQTWMSATAWNTRPIEDALQLQLAETQARITQLEAVQTILAKKLVDYTGSCPLDADDVAFDHCDTACTNNDTGECYILQAEEESKHAG